MPLSLTRALFTALAIASLALQVFLYPGRGISAQGLAPGAEIALDCFSSRLDTHHERDPPTAGDFHVE